MNELETDFITYELNNKNSQSIFNFDEFGEEVAKQLENNLQKQIKKDIFERWDRLGLNDKH